MLKNIPPQEVNSSLTNRTRSGKFHPVALSFILGLILFGLTPKLQAGNNLASPMPAGNFVEINLVAWVYLEGAMIDPGGTQTYSLPMRTTLNDLRFLPGQTNTNFMTGNIYIPAGQPYFNPPWNYESNEGAGYNSYGNPDPGTARYDSTVVDWVLVSIRSTPDGIPLCTKAALLHNDGHVEMVDGGFSCEDLEFTSYFVVIEHRNHLIVMSPQPVPVIDGTLTYDFRYSQSYIDNSRNEGYGQKELLPSLPGVYALFAGNGDQVQSSFSDTDINFDDRTYWGYMNGNKGQYCNGDYNMNGDCNWNDHLVWAYNNAIFSTVPINW